MNFATPVGFQFEATIFSHGWYQLLPFGHRREPSVGLSRIQQLADGTLVHIQIEADDSGLSFTVDQALSESQAKEVHAVVSRCLSLEQDVQAFYDFLREVPGYGWVEPAGAGRMLKAPSVWEDLAKTLLTTNTTWAMTKQMVGRLVMLGDAHAGGHTFPTPSQIAAFTPERLNEQVRAGYRGAYLHALAESIMSGRVDVEAWYGSDLPSDELYQQIRGLKGFGDYAAGSVLRLLGRHDTLGIDSVVRDMYRTRFNGGEKATDAAIRAHYEPYDKWRGLMMWMDVIAPGETA